MKTIFFDTIDIYGASANKFSYKGRETVHSYFGITFSFFHLLLMVAFAVIKF
jgi:hypothetical protein